MGTIARQILENFSKISRPGPAIVQEITAGYHRASTLTNRVPKFFHRPLET